MTRTNIRLIVTSYLTNISFKQKANWLTELHSLISLHNSSIQSHLCTKMTLQKCLCATAGMILYTNNYQSNPFLWSEGVKFWGGCVVSPASYPHPTLAQTVTDKSKRGFTDHWLWMSISDTSWYFAIMSLLLFSALPSVTACVNKDSKYTQKHENV